jgi:capsular polysaccharide transport system permease protein
MPETAQTPPQAQAKPPAQNAQVQVPPPAAPAGFRTRHRNLAVSFLIGVILPLLFSAVYLYWIAEDQYASYLGFSVRTEESGSAIELLGGITELSGSSSSDTDILYSYLTSQELVRRIDKTVDLRAIWSRVSRRSDPVFAFDPSGTIEDLVEHWTRKVTVVHDSSTGMIDIRVLAFDPEDARRIAEALRMECSDMINALSAAAREDAIKYAREELDVSIDRLKAARLALTSFRNRTQIVDPSIDTQNQMGLLVTLQQQLASTLIELDLLRDTSLISTDVRISQAEKRVAVIEARIEAERRKLGIGAGGGGDVAFANLVGEYEGLVVDREFAELSYTTALATYDAAQAEARRQSRYLAAHIRPTLAEKAEYPEREKLLLLIAMSLIFSWAILALLYYSLRDRR